MFILKNQTLGNREMPEALGNVQDQFYLSFCHLPVALNTFVCVPLVATGIEASRDMVLIDYRCPGNNSG